MVKIRLKNNKSIIDKYKEFNLDLYKKSSISGANAGHWVKKYYNMTIQTINLFFHILTFFVFLSILIINKMPNSKIFKWIFILDMFIIFGMIFYDYYINNKTLIENLIKYFNQKSKPLIKNRK